MLATSHGPTIMQTLNADIFPSTSVGSVAGSNWEGLQEAFWRNAVNVFRWVRYLPQLSQFTQSSFAITGLLHH